MAILKRLSASVEQSKCFAALTQNSCTTAMVRKPGWLIGFALLLAACSTKSPEPEFELTPATQTGANTGSFRVDGRVWQPYGRRCVGYGSCVEEPLKAYYDVRRGKFQIRGFLTTSTRYEDFSLSCDLFRIGPVSLPPTQFSHPNYGGGLGYAIAALPSDPKYNTFDPTKTTILITRIDTVAKVISGTFEGHLNGTLNINQSVTITEGRFDVKY